MLKFYTLWYAKYITDFIVSPKTISASLPLGPPPSCHLSSITEILCGGGSRGEKEKIAALIIKFAVIIKIYHYATIALAYCSTL